MPTTPTFSLSVTPAAFTLSRGYLSRGESARSHPHATIVITMTGSAQFPTDAYLWIDDGARGPGVTIGGYAGYVSFYGGTTLGRWSHLLSDPAAGPWHKTVYFATQPKSVPLGVHNCFICGQLQTPGNHTVVKVPLAITIVDP